MWRDTGRPVRVVFLDARACLPLLVFVVYWSWATFYIAATGVIVFSVISWAGLTVPSTLNDPPRLCWPLSPCGPGMEAPEVRVSAPGTTDLKTLDVGYVSQVVRALLDKAGRELFIEDTPRRDLVPIPFDAAAAEDGLLPVFLVAGEAIWRDVTGTGFDLKLERDVGALLSWRIEAIQAQSFSCVLLSVMEAIAQVARPDGVMALDLARVCDEATARTETRRVLGEEQRS